MSLSYLTLSDRTVITSHIRYELYRLNLKTDCFKGCYGVAFLAALWAETVDGSSKNVLAMFCLSLTLWFTIWCCCVNH